jgi:DNA primase
VLDKGEPKYLNSPETPVFSKGRELYGLFQARNAIRDAGMVVVVEGYMDVVALAQHGVDVAVATLGTSTTPVHVQKLFRLTDTVVFCFDGDNAGRKAAWRALENALPALVDGKNARFLFLPEGEDPDDFVRKRGKSAFEAAVAGAVPLSEFLLTELAAQHPPTSAEGRAALVAAARPHLAQISAPVLAALLRKRLAELAGLPESELRALVGTGESSSRPASARDDPAAARPPRGGFRRSAPSLARELIAGILLQPEVARTLSLPRPGDASPESAALSALADYCAAHDGALTTAGLMQQFAQTPHDALLANVLAKVADHAITPEIAEAQLREGVQRWWRSAQMAGSVDALPDEVTPMSKEEAERQRQLAAVRRTSGRDPETGRGR